jgi:type II secretory pathway component PulF
MKPKLIPELDKYMKKYNYTSSTYNWVKSLSAMTYNNLYFVFFITFFIMFLSYRYFMKKKLNQNTLKAVKIRNIYYESENA